MTEALVYDPYSHILFGVAITMLIVLSAIYLRLAKNKEDETSRMMNFGAAIAFFTFSLYVIFQLISDLHLYGRFVTYSFYSDFTRYDEWYELLVRLSYAATFIAMSLFFYTFEKIKNSNHFITILLISFTFFTFIIPFELVALLAEIAYGFVMMVLVFIMHKYGKWSREEYRSIAGFITFGGVIMGFGITLLSINSKKLNIPLFLSPLMMIIGSLIIIYPILFEIEDKLDAMEVWKRLNIFSIIFYGGVGGFYFLLYSPPITYSFSIIGIIFVLSYSRYDMLRKDDVLERIEVIDVLTSFVQPRRISDEEVSISKEKKICVVCKGKVARYNIYLCTGCSTFYCQNCSEVLKGMENACWVCQSPFDESKPVNIQTMEEEPQLTGNKKILIGAQKGQYDELTKKHPDAKTFKIKSEPKKNEND